MSDPPPARRTVKLTQAGYISLHLYRRFFSPQVARKQKFPPKFFIEKMKRYSRRDVPPCQVDSEKTKIIYQESPCCAAGGIFHAAARRARETARKTRPLCPAQASRKSPIRSIGKRKPPQRRQHAGGQKILDNTRNL